MSANGLTRRWRWRGAAPLLDDDLTLGRNLPPLVRRVLRARGFEDADAVRRFCEPKLTDLVAPAELPGATAAATRLVEAVREDASIVIYGDYDVDGMTATAILHHMIRTANPAARIQSYVPHRLEEGYGINAEALRSLRAGGADLVVSVDCGITAVEPARVARAIGLDLIVTDHHNPLDDGRLPDAFLVHPRLPGSEYPCGDLAGAGVAFKLAWRFAQVWCGSERVSKVFQERLLALLPLVALGTIADVVPLASENRVLARFGLTLLGATTHPGLRALLDASGLQGEAVDTEKVGFVLGPRLNACGRLGHAADAVTLLTDATGAQATDIAERLNAMNDERRRTERRITEEAATRAEEAGMTGPDRRVIVLADTGWHPGVVGIVCSRLVERFGRPAILLQRDGDVLKGSARSIPGYSIYGGLAACAEHLLGYGGHDAAAGVQLAAGELDAFVAALTRHANERIAPEELTPSVTVDCTAHLGEIDLPAVVGLKALAPFGRGNRRPTVRVDDLRLTEPPRPVGARSKHLALRLQQETPAGPRRIRAIWWGGGEHAATLATGMHLDVVAIPRLNSYQGRDSAELEIRDLRPRPAAVIVEPGPQREASTT